MLAAPALEEAAAPIRDGRTMVQLALDEGYPDAPAASQLLMAAVKRLVPAATVGIPAGGEAAFGPLLLEGLNALSARQVDAVVLGGVHTDYDPRAVAALEESGRLFSPDNLDARIPGEGAACVVLMRDADAGRTGLRALARVLGVGTGRERAGPHDDVPAYEALGLTSAVHQAAEPLARAGQTAGWVLTDLTGEVRRLREWQAAFVRMQDALGPPYIIESPAQRIGYLGAAAMPLFVAMAATAWEHGYAPSPVAIATAGSDGGERAAVVLASAARGAAEEERA
ncbi:beta-ketoacyl synthase N-terminal-like domain-containing protein [Sorangium sp. So ce1024]|uniref:beta-ketoacyl synthase N-terminal-like domain-containing protein n=1 Tax=unclassified Sorangium TaxID=2621164 RepID=UPI003F0475D5